MRFARRAGLIAGVVAVLAVLGGCGSTGGKLLTTGAATQLKAELNQASLALGQYNCQVAYTALTNFRDDVGQLQGVNATLVQMLSDGASRIDQLANNRCPTGASTTTTETRTKPTKTSSTVTTATQTTTSSTDTSTVDTSTGGNDGGAPITTVQTTPPVTTPAVTTPSTPATSTQESGGAGFGASSGGTGVGQ